MNLLKITIIVALLSSFNATNAQTTVSSAWDAGTVKTIGNTTYLETTTDKIGLTSITVVYEGEKNFKTTIVAAAVDVTIKLPNEVVKAFDDNTVKCIFINDMRVSPNQFTHYSKLKDYKLVSLLAKTR